MTTELCSDDEVANLVHAFYAKVRADAVLGPIFNAHIDDWEQHLAKLVCFWSSMLRRTGQFTGSPMPTHLALPGLSAALFERWLTLFRATTAAQPNAAMQEQANAMAQRIADSLWRGYQTVHHIGTAPQTHG